jgi:hypothetical protein
MRGWRATVGALTLALATASCSGVGRGARIEPAAHPPTAAAPAQERYTERDLVLDPPVAYGDQTVWFADELWPVADAVAAFLARPDAGGYRVIAPAAMRAFWRDVQAGGLPGVANRCEAAPPPARLARYIYRGASFAEVRIDCPTAKDGVPLLATAPCRLEVETSAPRPTPGDPENLEAGSRFVATLSPGEAPARWAERVRASGLTRTAASDRSGGLGIAGMIDMATPGAGRPRFAVRNVAQSIEWQAPISTATFMSHGEALAACGDNQRTWRDWWMQPYLIEVNAAGTVDRCEFQHPDHLPVPAFPCICDVMRKVAFGAGPAGRRARFDLTLMDNRSPSAPRDRLRRIIYVEGVQASDRSAILGSSEIDRRALEACLWPVTTPVARMIVPVRLVVGADGRVTGAETRWVDAVPPPVRNCVDQVLGRAQFACPLSGAARVEARLSIAVHGN